MSIDAPRNAGTLQRFRAHIPAPLSVTTGGVILPFTSVDDNPSSWVATGNPTYDVAIPEAGQYDIIAKLSFASATNNKNCLVYLTPAGGGAANLVGGTIQPGGAGTLVNIALLDQTIAAGEKISILASMSTAAQNVTTASIYITKRAAPFV